MTSPSLVLGVDGGGSSTRAVLSDLSGNVRGRGAAGASNPFAVGREGCDAALNAAVAEAFMTAGLPRQPVAFAVLGIAGLLGERETQLVEHVARSLALASGLLVIHDLHIALEGGLTGGPGVVLIAGTGSSCYARGARGNGVITGGKGPVAGDSGSAYWVAHRALRMAVKQLDGRLPRGPLAGAVLEQLSLQNPADLVKKLYQPSLPARELARLCPAVVQLASQGDEFAAAIVEKAQDALAEMVQAGAGRVHLHNPAVILTGGLARAGLFRPGLEAAIVRRIPGASFPERRLPPVGGAVLCALRGAGAALDDALVERLAAGMLAD
ncbi:MAG: N-acetylglucosamine kinase-like BadF-type ATPase [Rhodothermales bacterium]|jgi:N-acetylglucosamine kinase-like BadF-type ATPase